MVQRDKSSKRNVVVDPINLAGITATVSKSDTHSVGSSTLFSQTSHRGIKRERRETKQGMTVASHASRQGTKQSRGMTVASRIEAASICEFSELGHSTKGKSSNKTKSSDSSYELGKTKKYEHPLEEIIFETGEKVSSPDPQQGFEIEAIEIDRSNRSGDKNLKVNKKSFGKRKLWCLVFTILVGIATVAVGSWFLATKTSNSNPLEDSPSGELAQDKDIFDFIFEDYGNDDEDAMTSLMDFWSNFEFGNATLSPSTEPIRRPPTFRPIPESTESPTGDGTNIWTDWDPKPTSEPTAAPTARCPDNYLMVNSQCNNNGGVSVALSLASFCFDTKRDGDWYWVRGGTGYDSWDYLDQREGDLALPQLARGVYTISLVRDSMEPYNELISHEFVVPRC